MEAELSVGFLSFNESYVSTVTCVPFKSVQVCSPCNTGGTGIDKDFRLVFPQGCCILFNPLVHQSFNHMEIQPGTASHKRQEQPDTRKKH